MKLPVDSVPADTGHEGLRAVALLEASKGCVALFVGLGIHALVGHNVRQVAEELFNHLHLNPSSHYPAMIISRLGALSEFSLNAIAVTSAIYALVRFVEAYGLWHKLKWTEWFALVSGAIYLPFEIYEFIFNRSAIGTGILLLNIWIVWYMCRVLTSGQPAKVD